MWSLNENWINNRAVKTWFRCLEFKTCRNVNLVYGPSMSLMGGRAHSSSVPRLYLPNYAIFTEPNPWQSSKYGTNGFNRGIDKWLVQYVNTYESYIVVLETIQVLYWRIFQNNYPTATRFYYFIKEGNTSMVPFWLSKTKIEDTTIIPYDFYDSYICV